MLIRPGSCVSYPEKLIYPAEVCPDLYRKEKAAHRIPVSVSCGLLVASWTLLKLVKNLAFIVGNQLDQKAARILDDLV
jgi:hypothetical protein